MTYNVNTKENKIPPTITTPIPIRLLAPAPNARAIGKAPSAVAILVIKIGRKRAAAAIAHLF